MRLGLLSRSALATPLADPFWTFISHGIAFTLGGISVVVLIAFYYGAGPEE